MVTTYPLEEVIELQRILQDRLRQISEEHPVQANTALAVHRNTVGIVHGETFGESGVTREECDRLLDTDGFATTIEEQIAFGDTLNILLLLATIANKKPDPVRIRQIRKMIEVSQLFPTNTSDATN